MSTLLTFKAPCCGERIQVSAALQGFPVEQMSKCPHCDSDYMLIVTSTKAAGATMRPLVPSLAKRFEQHSL